MPLAAVVVVVVLVQLPDGSYIWRRMDLPERGVPLAVRVPERVKDWLAGTVAEAVRVIVVGVVPIVGLGVPPTVTQTWVLAPA